MSRRLLAVVLALLAGPARAFDITSCNVTVPANDTGTLQADLDCTNLESAGVRLERNATLEMNGHTISGNFGVALETLAAGIVCLSRRCTVHGPGEVVGQLSTSRFGIGLRDGVRLFVDAVSIHGFDAGISGPGTPSRNRVKATNVTLDQNYSGVQSVRSMLADDVSASQNVLVGFAVDKLRGRTLTASGNGASGVFGNRVAVTGLVARDNGDAGVRVLRAVLRDSEIVGNDGYATGIDVLTLNAPQVVNTTCGRSGLIGGAPTDTWGVCTND